MTKVYLFGKHAIRTPFSYESYRLLFQRQVNYVDNPKAADLLIVGYLKDIIENEQQLQQIFKGRSEINVMILSEEPLWDTAPWNIKYKDFYKQNVQKLNLESLIVNIFYFGHCNSNLFEFERLPYFLTTNDDFFIRYAYLFKRNACLSLNEISLLLEKATTAFAFYIEKRNEKRKYDIYENGKLIGMSVYRTDIAAKLQNKAKVVGFGWSDENKPRQKLPDWHLDKLLELDKSTFLVSALENTYANTYMSEKIFDAFAVLGIPIYFASEEHSVFKVVKTNSFLNIFGTTAKEAVEKIQSFEISEEFLEQYIETQAYLYKLFSDGSKLRDERDIMVQNTMSLIRTVV